MATGSEKAGGTQSREDRKVFFYRVQFRPQGKESVVRSAIADLQPDTICMVKTDHGLEPAQVCGRMGGVVCQDKWETHCQVGVRRATREESERFHRLPRLEADAFRLCRELIQQLHLPMHLVRVERFFSGSKIIFYFTSENRVDFRELVKKLVQEFRTRVEMRQIGVRHETQMTGGIGPCGRELCCTTFLHRFESVSIKMAKAQELPLNPAKISGLCNRLLCCLTYEYSSYRDMKAKMPRVGRTIEFEGQKYRVVRNLPLPGQIRVVGPSGQERLLNEAQWRQAREVVNKNNRGKKKKPSARKKRGRRKNSEQKMQKKNT